MKPRARVSNNVPVMAKATKPSKCRQPNRINFPPYSLNSQDFLRKWFKTIESAETSTAAHGIINIYSQFSYCKFNSSPSRYNIMNSRLK